MSARSHAVAWVGLTLALALHVADEAVHDFLGFYNPFVMMLRDMTLITWLPTYDFGPWLGGLIVAVALLLGLSRFAFRGARWTAWAALVYSVVLFFNAAAHIGGSLWTQRLLPGVLSSPLLAAAACWLLSQAVGVLRRPA
jgi:hypothetical protein